MWGGVVSVGGRCGHSDIRGLVPHDGVPAEEGFTAVFETGVPGWVPMSASVVSLSDTLPHSPRGWPRRDCGAQASMVTST